MEAWKKHKPNNIFLNACWHASPLLTPASSNQSFSMERYARNKLDFSPFGGSFVIFKPFCRTLTGKSGLGIAVSQSRNWSCTLSGCRSSTNTSSLPIQDDAKWQFWRITHKPCSRPSMMALSAFLPCPCPRDTDCCRSFMPILWAKRTISAIGSAPDESTKMRGVTLFESSKDFSRLKDGGSKYSRPNFAAMISCNPCTVQSGRTASKTNARCKGDIDSFNPPGQLVSDGLSASKTDFQAFTFCLKLPAKFCHGPRPNLSNSQTLSQLTSVSQSACGFGLADPTPPQASNNMAFSS
mmetsp:Transcript_17018/g.59547  ORF Transcript_17018/g.59547 Transcript_17018/m.59547 type:complete len:296 (-) Transcript_17018:1049-1936(-)